jgi:hypothetical protein
MSEQRIYERDSLKLIQPFNCVISGPTQCGKTYFLTELLLANRSILDKPIQRLIYCYGAWLSDTFLRLKQSFGEKLELHRGFTNIEEFNLNSKCNNCIVIDDLMTDAIESKQISDLFTRGSHHQNLSVFLLTQNLFQQGKFAKTITDNSQYLVCFKNPLNKRQISFVSRKMSENGKTYNPLIEAFQDATFQKNRSYIFIDSRPEQDDDLRLRTNILPAPQPQPLIVYKPVQT